MLLKCHKFKYFERKMFMLNVAFDRVDWTLVCCRQSIPISTIGRSKIAIISAILINLPKVTCIYETALIYECETYSLHSFFFIVLVQPHSVVCNVMRFSPEENRSALKISKTKSNGKKKQMWQEFELNPKPIEFRSDGNGLGFAWKREERIVWLGSYDIEHMYECFYFSV